MYKGAFRSAWVEINLSNLEYNIIQINSKVGKDKEVIGVIKADAYGHGAYEVAKVLRKNAVKIFAVATLQEAITLRDEGIDEDIIIMGLTPDIYAEAVADYDIMPVVCSYDNARAFSEVARIKGKTVRGLIAVDTGMGRIGYLHDDQEALEEIVRISTLPSFQIKGIFSHMATADTYDKSFAKLQECRYMEFCKKMKSVDIECGIRTLANSAAIIEIPSIYYDAVRPGIILYGCYPSEEVDRGRIDIKPVMSVKANIVHLKRVPMGFSVGYGRRFIAKRESLIGTLSLGYADGYPRAYSSQAQVIVNGVMAPVAGNICMDQCMIDVTDVQGVKVGDEVIIMGSDGENRILAEDIANAVGTISYEIVCAFGQRLPKVYVR